MKDFDIEIFNKQIEIGESYMLNYLGATVIWYIKLSHNYEIKDYIKSLYQATYNMYNCVISSESTKDSELINKFDDIWEKYVELRDMLFNELGIEYKNDKYILKNRKILKKLEEVN